MFGCLQNRYAVCSDGLHCREHGGGRRDEVIQQAGNRQELVKPWSNGQRQMRLTGVSEIYLCEEAHGYDFDVVVFRRDHQALCACKHSGKVGGERLQT